MPSARAVTDLAGTITHALTASLRCRRARARPYAHWLLRRCLPDEVADNLAALPIAPAAIGDTAGRRETHNESRVHFGVDHRRRYAVMDALARAFQSPAAVGALEAATGARLSGTSLRMEYCQDTDGFWLEPHTDIGAKRFTMLVYLNRGEEALDWGTDVYAAPGVHAGRAPAGFNTALVFVPGDDTWHGFERRPINGVRKTLIVNYVGPEWRNRGELCFPDTAAG